MKYYDIEQQQEITVEQLKEDYKQSDMVQEGGTFAQYIKEAIRCGFIEEVK